LLIQSQSPKAHLQQTIDNIVYGQTPLTIRYLLSQLGAHHLEWQQITVSLPNSFGKLPVILQNINLAYFMIISFLGLQNTWPWSRILWATDKQTDTYCNQLCACV